MDVLSSIRCRLAIDADMMEEILMHGGREASLKPVRGRRHDRSGRCQHARPSMSLELMVVSDQGRR